MSELNTVYIESEVNEIYASTEAKQTFINPLDKPIELLINFPIKEEIQLSRFQVTINNKIVISKVLEKEKAKEKYNDSISDGNVGILGSYDENSYSYNVTIGNIKPKEKVELITYYLQMITSEDMSFQYEIMQHYPNFISKDMKEEDINKNRAKNLEGKIKIKTQSRLTRLIIPLLDEKKIKFEKKYNEDYTEVEITISKSLEDIITKAPTRFINMKKLEDKNNDLPNHFYRRPCIIKRPYWFTGNLKPYSFQSPTEGIEPSFNILFRTELMNTPFIYTQYNPEKNNTSIALTFTYNSSNLNIPVPKDKPDEENDLSYYNSFQKDSVNDLPSLFIFLIDQSGSMSGKSIELVKQALILFIQSLPPKSYFQLIGFGSNYEKYNQKPVEYNKENVESIMETINQLRANKGGTNLFSPLDDIFKSKDYDNIDLSHNIFILTDGQIENRETVQNSIVGNVNRFRIHSIGIGNDFDKILIERCGKLGKGSSNFVPNVEEINDVVIDSLNKSLRPYLVKTKFDIKNIQKLYECPPLCNFFYQDDVINYSLLINGKNENNEFDIEIKSNDTKKDIKENLKINKIIKLPDGEILSRIIIGNYLKLKKDLVEEEEIKIAKEYQVLSKNTSLFGEIIGEGGQNELIKVELGKNDQRNRYFYQNKNFMMMNNMMVGGPSIRSFGMKSMMMAASAPMKKKKMSKGSKALNKIDSLADSMNAKVFLSSNNNLDNFNNFRISENKEKNENKNQFNDLQKIIMSQDIIEGYWEENKNTKNIESKFKEIFNKISNFIESNENIKNKSKVKYTFIILYYLINDEKEKLNENKLIINKGKKYLISNNTSYDEIFSKI